MTETPIQESEAHPVITETEVDFVGAEGNRLVGTLYRLGTDDDATREPQAVALFMHGGGQTRHSWQGAAQKLAALGIDAVSLDARGHGDSAWSDTQSYRLDDFAKDLGAVARKMALEYGRLPILIGASMGGLATMRAQQIVGTGLFEAIIFVDITPNMQRSGVDRILGFMGDRVAEGFASPQEAADAIAAYLPGRSRPKSLDGLSKNLRQRADGRYYWHWDPAFVTGARSITHEGEDSYAMLKDAVMLISVPTLLVRGSKSELVSEEAVTEFRALLPHAKTVDISEAGHMVAGDKNDVFAQAVIDFVNADVLRKAA
ncbi:MAG: alpha/beta hydrolase [Pseudomonadota bacterium]